MHTCLSANQWSLSSRPRHLFLTLFSRIEVLHARQVYFGIIWSYWLSYVLWRRIPLNCLSTRRSHSWWLCLHQTLLLPFLLNCWQNKHWTTTSIAAICKTCIPLTWLIIGAKLCTLHSSYLILIDPTHTSLIHLEDDPLLLFRNHRIILLLQRHINFTMVTWHLIIQVLWRHTKRLLMQLFIAKIWLHYDKYL